MELICDKNNFNSNVLHSFYTHLIVLSKLQQTWTPLWLPPLTISYNRTKFYFFSKILYQIIMKLKSN